jgi:hypothetical protein
MAMLAPMIQRNLVHNVFRLVSKLYMCQSTYSSLLKYWLTPSSWPLVRKRTIPTERPPLVDEILVKNHCKLSYILVKRKCYKFNTVNLLSLLYSGGALFTT